MKPIDKSQVPASPEHQVVGKLTKPHGIRGEIFIHIFSKEAEWLDELEEIRLIRFAPGAETEYLNLSLKKKQWHKDGLILSSPDISDRNRAEELKGCFFEIPESFLQTDSEDDFYLQEILDFQVLDASGALLGRISGFDGTSMQDLLKIKRPNGEEVLVPLVDDFIVSLDRDSQKIIMELPPGLLDLDDQAKSDEGDSR